MPGASIELHDQRDRPPCCESYLNTNTHISHQFQTADRTERFSCHYTNFDDYKANRRLGYEG
jgi:hypothetical protein